MNQGLSYELDAVMPAARATGLDSSLATFKDRPGGANPTVNSSGQVDLTNYVPVAGLINIPCQLSVLIDVRPAVDGARMPDHFTESGDRHLLLYDYYPQVLQRYIVTVDGTDYEITPGAVEPSSQQRQTRLGIRQYSL